ncbi:hypothetical protein PLESTB_000740300 [Pleodorina starrii]|uniref:Uncharacterized protein n=1 Tax=Pleodorina starrii TaxID=330485 RepID=A0A9W6F1Z2_9CHLO|nr:hypothetical protein PLESTM_000184200 [Pleodorina starrii]GLC53397.1 hypothetical protein PLESTB_000740300 [Pleodorina starrii]GLC67133.1 hypothetical protein PLESTF_000520900 [Pleodorina starrii]
MAELPYSQADTCAAFDLLGLFDSILLPSAVLTLLDLNTRKLLRVCCKRLRAEVDVHVTSITINRYNISKLQPTQPGSLAARYPRLRRLAFGANEPRDVAALLRSQLPSLAPSLACLDFWSYYASVSSELWAALVELAPPALTLRLNINESLLRRMEVDAVLGALRALRSGRPGLVVEFAAGHTSFGFRSTERETLRFLASAEYIRSLGFSIGLRGRELQDGRFFEYLAAEAAPRPPPPAAAAAAATPSPAARAITALSLTHYEAEERPPVGPLLAGLHLLTALRSLTLDCEISLTELAPLAACDGLTQLTVDLLVARAHAPRPAAAPPLPAWNAAAGGAAGGLVAATVPLPQVRSLTLGRESHPAQPLADVFPRLTELVSVPCTRNVGVYNVFHCGLMLGGAGLTALARLTLGCVVAAAAAPGALAAAASLTALAFTHADNESTAGLLRAAAALPRLRRLALWDHEDADEYLALKELLSPPPTAAAPLPPPVVFRHLEELEVRATAPDFFQEVQALLAEGALRFGPCGGDGGEDGGGDGGGGGGVRRARLDACYDPPLLVVGQLGSLLAALGPGLRGAVVSGWATPGSEAALLALGQHIGRPGLVMEYEYPLL